jgi:hypothetical protein
LTQGQKNITIIHQSTVKRLSPTEKFFLDVFVKEGTYRIVADEKVTSG